MHQHAGTAGGGKVDQAAQQVQRAAAHGGIVRHQRQAFGFHQQPVQAGDLQAMGQRGRAQLARRAGAALVERAGADRAAASASNLSLRDRP